MRILDSFPAIKMKFYFSAWMLVSDANPIKKTSFFSDRKNMSFHLGGMSVHFQMLNQESRRYFKRAFAISGSAFNSIASIDENHVWRVQECTKIYQMDKLIEYLKMENKTTALARCYHYSFWDRNYPVWVPFLTKSLEEIYNSFNGAPDMDSWFSFTSQVLLTNQK